MHSKDKHTGIIFVTLAYVMWGCLPVFWKLLDAVPALYVLCARVVWSLIFAACYLTCRKGWEKIGRIVRDRKTAARCALAGIVICINWGSYIWAVNNGHLIDSSLGYYINPILVITLGVVCFKERLTVREWLAVFITGAGVIYLVIRSGTVPILAIVIGGSFAIYGMIKKGLAVDSVESLFLETLFVSPMALGYILYAEICKTGAVGVLLGFQWGLLPLAGIITAIPLLTYSAGVKKIPFYMTGILMYLNPTIQFLIGLFLYKEVLDKDKLLAFVFIWAGVALMLFRGKETGQSQNHK